MNVTAEPKINCLYSSVVERQSCKLKVLGSIPSGGSFYSGGLFLIGNPALKKHRFLTRWRACDLLLISDLCGSPRVHTSCLLLRMPLTVTKAVRTP